MTGSAFPHAQRGVTLVIALIMLVLLTLLVITAYSLSTSNLRAVGNMQLRNEAIAAANVAIEREIGSSFINLTGPFPTVTLVDINNDANNDYRVNIEQPECVRASQVTLDSLSSVTLGPAMSSSPFWNTVWDFNATVTELRGSGTSVRVRQGVRVLVSQLSAAHAPARAACGI